MPDEITLGELSRNISAMRGDFDRRFVEMNRRLDNLQFVSRDAYEVQIKALIEDVEDLKDSKKWLARSMALAFVVAFLAPILVATVVAR